MAAVWPCCDSIQSVLRKFATPSFSQARGEKKAAWARAWTTTGVRCEGSSVERGVTQQVAGFGGSVVGLGQRKDGGGGVIFFAEPGVDERLDESGGGDVALGAGGVG